MAVSAVIFNLNSRRIICSYRSPHISQLRYLRRRLIPTNVNGCHLTPVRQPSLACLRERFASGYSFVRWNTSSSASSGVQNAEVSLLIFSCSFSVCESLKSQHTCYSPDRPANNSGFRYSPDDASVYLQRTHPAQYL